MCDRALFYRKYWSKVGLKIFSIQKAKIMYGWGFILLKQLKEGTAEDLFY